MLAGYGINVRRDLASMLLAVGLIFVILNITGSVA